jgi:hypothetical protein
VSPKALHAQIDYRPYWAVKVNASAQHSSQGGGTSRSRLLPEWLQRRVLAKDSYIRAFPPPPPGLKETDLFPERL